MPRRRDVTNRLKKEYEMAVKKQERLAQKTGKAGPAVTAHASAVEEKPQFSAL